MANIDIKENFGTVEVTSPDGDVMRDHSVIAVLLFNILEELKKLNSSK